MQQDPVRVLVVDDSAFVRLTVERYLAAETGITVVGSARHGREALELIPRLDPDVITLDVEMPHMDGLTALGEIMARWPRPVVMLSSFTVEGARETVQALTLGAVDFLPKPQSRANLSSAMEDLAKKIRRAARTRVGRTTIDRDLSGQGGRAAAANVSALRPFGWNDRVVVVGASTGGPRALTHLMIALPASLPASLIVVQHMPLGFTRPLAERINGVSTWHVAEARGGEVLQAGQALVAPAGSHLILEDDHRVALSAAAPKHGVRPAVDVTLKSAAACYGRRVVAVVLTGMGRDGAEGALAVREAGGRVIVEDEATCVVWGMPRYVIEAGAADDVVPLHEIPEAITRAVDMQGR